LIKINVGFAIVHSGCSIHTLPTHQILFTYIFYLYYLCYFILEFTFYILHPNILQQPCKRDLVFSETLLIVQKYLCGSQPEDGFMK